MTWQIFSRVVLRYYKHWQKKNRMKINVPVVVIAIVVAVVWQKTANVQIANALNLARDDFY